MCYMTIFALITLILLYCGRGAPALPVAQPKTPPPAATHAPSTRVCAPTQAISARTRLVR